jgi:putative heme-binding domain-containing protein
MQTIHIFTIASVLAAGIASAQPPAQAQRGQALWEKSPKGVACATCHKIKGIGTAVGPDLTPLAAVVGSHGLVKTIQMQSTEYVQDVKTGDGKTFPGIQKEKKGDELQIWNLGEMPPVLLTLQAKDVTSMTRDTKWKHPPTSAGYTSQELADIIGFMKWAATGSKTEIKIADVEDAK